MLSNTLSPRQGASSDCGWREGQTRRVDVNIRVFNKQSRTGDKVWSSS